MDINIRTLQTQGYSNTRITCLTFDQFGNINVVVFHKQSESNAGTFVPQRALPVLVLFWVIVFN